MFRAVIASCLLVSLSACVNTPNTKALVTPLGAVGFHTFAPQRSPDQMPPNAEGISRIAANLQACAADGACPSHQ
jgi:hypothetical protein